MTVYQGLVLALGLFAVAVVLGGLWSGAFFNDYARPIRRRRLLVRVISTAGAIVRPRFFSEEQGK